jgi:hypothetical protein
MPSASRWLESARSKNTQGQTEKALSEALQVDAYLGDERGEF